jgi:dihydrodipicolinate synthase/N-acetylneuraminate lyase
MIPPTQTPWHLLKPKRKIVGMSAILLPFLTPGIVDWESFDEHVTKTLAAGLIPALNMDTGYAQLIDEATRKTVLERTQKLCAGKEYVAGAFVGDAAGATLNLDGYKQAIAQIQQLAGTPVIFPSYGFASIPEPDLPQFFEDIATVSSRFIAFELGKMFVPNGRIFGIETYIELLKNRACIGAKHSSLSRVMEWQRLEIRNALQPEFMVLTGNDLAIDMVMFGSDYLLGLSTFAPDAFALRDRYWYNDDPRFFELNDLLQYLGQITFRHPVPAYKHNAAQFLYLRQWIRSNLTHPKAATRPESDIAILEDIARRLQAMMQDV